MSKLAPRLSIGMPVYNGELYLSLAIEAILAQTFTDFELVISDNASTDGTPEICARYARNDNRIRYARFDRNMGAARNFNNVIELSQGEYFKWASHDDLHQPTFFERCVEIMEQHPEVSLAYPRTMLIDADGNPVHEYPAHLNLRHPRPSDRLERFLDLYRIPHMCNPVFGVMRLKTLRRTNQLGAFVSSDVILLAELLLHGTFWEIDELLFWRRDHPGASVRANPSFRERIAWFDPAKRGTLQLTHWRWLQEYLAAIRRAPISAVEKARCRRLMVRWAAWDARGLSKDLVKMAAWPVIRRLLANRSGK